MIVFSKYLYIRIVRTAKYPTLWAGFHSCYSGFEQLWNDSRYTFYRGQIEGNFQTSTLRSLGLSQFSRVDSQSLQVVWTCLQAMCLCDNNNVDITRENYVTLLGYSDTQHQLKWFFSLNKWPEDFTVAIHSYVNSRKPSVLYVLIFIIYFKQLIYCSIWRKKIALAIKKAFL